MWKKFVYKTGKIQVCIFFITLSVLALSQKATAGDEGLNDSIVRFRKGEIVIRAKQGSHIEIEQLSHEFWFGCALPNSFGGGMPESDLVRFKEKFLDNFNAAVTENALKWGVMERKKDEVNFAVVDSILNWTERSHIPLRGHNLFWGILKSPNTGMQYVQDWVTKLDDEELRQRIRNRAENITKRYKGRFAEYDLNNEMIHGNYFEDRLGPEITKQMAQWAHNGDPDAKLWVNDYDILIPESPLGIGLPEYMAHIRKLLKQGIPISGIGVQGHSHLETFDRQYLRKALDSLATFGLPVRITEFNLPGMRSELKQKQLTPEQEETKAREIVDFYRICFSHPAVEGILMWGFWEGANWIPSSSLFKRDWTPTPAAEAYHNLVFKEWWTHENGVADRKGIFTLKGFYGKYKVTVDGISKEFDLTKKSGKATVVF